MRLDEAVLNPDDLAATEAASPTTNKSTATIKQGFFSYKPKFNHADTNTYEIHPYLPSAKNRFYTLAGYITDANSTSLANADQIAFTPVRVIDWLVSIGAMGALAAISPWFVLIAAVPLAIFVIGGIARKALRRPIGEKSVVLFERRFSASEREQITIRQRSIKKNGEPLNAAEPTKGRPNDVELYSWKLHEEVTAEEKREAGTDGKEIYLSAYYKNKDSQFITHIKLNSKDRDAFLDPELKAEDKVAKALALKNTYLNKIVIQAEEAPSTLGQHLRKHYAHMSRFEIIRETLWLPLKFIFGIAMPYWAIWSIANLLGDGIREIQPDHPFLLPFSSYGLAFGLPLAIGIALVAARALLAYRNKNIPKNDPKIEARAKIFLSLSTSEKEAKAEWVKAGGLLTNFQAAANALQLLNKAEKPLEPPTWSSFFYGIKTLFIKDYSIRNMLSTSLLSHVIRSILQLPLRFASGFIFAYISAWPILDFAVLKGLSLETATIIQFGLSLTAGISFGFYALWKQAKIELRNYKQLNAIKKDPVLLNHLLALEEKVLDLRAAVATLEKTVNKLLSDKSRERAMDSPNKQSELNIIQRLLSQSYSIARAREALDEEGLIDGKKSIIKHDSWTYRGKNQLQSSTRRGRFYTFLERAFDRINEFMGAGGSAALIVRLAVGASSMAFGVGGALTLFGGALIAPHAAVIPLGIILALGIFGSAWALTRLFKLLDGKNERFKQLFLSQTPAVSESLMINECLTLKARRARLENLEKQLQSYPLKTSSSESMTSEAILNVLATAIPPASPALSVSAPKQLPPEATAANGVIAVSALPETSIHKSAAALITGVGIYKTTATTDTKVPPRNGGVTPLISPAAIHSLNNSVEEADKTHEFLSLSAH